MSVIAFFHNALGKTDGVSLEVDKWRSCLEDMGHRVLYCAGNNDDTRVYCIPELDFFHPQTRTLIHNATVALTDYTPEQLVQAIEEQAAIIEQKLLRFLELNEPDFLVPNNLLSVGYHVSALLAFSRVIENTGIPTIAHNHDFYFEDSGEVSPTCPQVWDILDTYSPPNFQNVQNLVINKLAQKQLLQRKNILSRVVPNVFDFDQPPWVLDDFNRDLREELSISQQDVVFLQATRVMDRKGIELAIDLVGKVKQKIPLHIGRRLYDGRAITDSTKPVLVCAGRIERFGISGNYKNALESRAAKIGVDIRFVGKRVKHSRGVHPQRGKLYSLWDTYVHGDFVTYPSWWEGWGNQFIEAVHARLPIAYFEYPVFETDLKPSGLGGVSLGNKLMGPDSYGLFSVDEHQLEQAAEQAIELLLDTTKRQELVQKNFEIARENFSFETLKTILQELFF